MSVRIPESSFLRGCFDVHPDASAYYDNSLSDLTHWLQRRPTGHSSCGKWRTSQRKKHADKLVEIGTLANKTFSKFISGQCLEAIILGTLMFIAFTISGFPYALMLAVLTAITSLIPIFGALIAMVIGAILIGIGNPVQAIIFVIVFQVVQQIEGNFIYPRVVGASVGLSPLWTLLAITVGGNLFGIPGILLGLPVASVLYALIKELVNGRLKNKAIKIS